MRAGISVRVRIRVRDGVRISNRVRRRVKLVNYSLITALSIATSADPHIRFLPVANKLCYHYIKCVLARIEKSKICGTIFFACVY